MKEKMWAYLIHLSENMWNDAEGDGSISPYVPEMKVDYEVWRDTIDFLPTQGLNTVLVDVGDAIQYESHPEISVKGAWTKDKLKAELDHMRAIGLTPIPKLNFSTSHDAWLGIYSRMVSTPKYYQVCEDVIKEVAELFDYPEYFHLGYDEETWEFQSGFGFCVIRHGDLWWHDVYKNFDVCDKVGARPWVWSDYCWYHPETFLKKMPKSVLQSNYYYNHIRKNPDGSYQNHRYDAYRVLNEAGFDQVPTCSMFNGNHRNAYETVQLGVETIDPDKLVGFMTAPWHFERKVKESFLRHEALQLGLAKKAFYPDDK